ncbi:acyl-CoA dehydrogenase family protein [Streptococcus dentasini]
MSYFSNDFISWLDDNAVALDQHSGALADSLLERIAAQGVFRIGVPRELGGMGGSYQDVIDVLTELSYHSLTAAFISWGHRTFIENILASDNPYPRETWLDDILTGRVSAGTGLSNCVKYLSDIEELEVKVIEEDGHYYLHGRLPWVTNVRSDNYIAVFAAAYDQSDERPPLILAVPKSAGIKRSQDLEFISLQGANTAALTFNMIPLDENWVLSRDAKRFIAETRSAFLGYQFGLAFGLAQRSLTEVETNLSANRLVLQDSYQDTLAELNRIKTHLYSGLESPAYFLQHVRELFQLRIDIVQVVADSLLLELQAVGGRGYIKASNSSFARRWQEGAFLPIVSPSAVQLRHILAT